MSQEWERYKASVEMLTLIGEPWYERLEAAFEAGRTWKDDPSHGMIERRKFLEFYYADAKGFQTVREIQEGREVR